MARRNAGLFSFVQDERMPKLMGIFLLFLAAYLTIAFISYLFTWDIDQDRVLRFSWGLFFLEDVEMANWLGRLGAILSNMFFYWGFGLPAFVFIYLFYRYGMALIRNEPLYNLRWIARYSLVLVVFLSILLHFILGSVLDFPFGGAFGAGVCGWIVGFVGNVGMFLLIILVIFGFVTWAFNPNYSELTYQDAVTHTKGFFSDMFNRRYRSERSRSASMQPAVATNGTTNTGKGNGPRTAVSKAYNSVEAITGGGEPQPTANPTPTPAADPKEGATGTQTEPVLDENGQLAMDLERRLAAASTRPVSIRPGGTDFEIEENLVPPTVTDETEIVKPIAPPLPPMTADQLVAAQGLYDPTLELINYEHPVTMLLDDYSNQKIEVDRGELEANKDQIISTLLNYKIEIVKIRATIGPTVTLYEIVPAPGVRISRIKSLEDDIALSLAALGIRIIAPIPGRGTIGIEVPNKSKQIVSLREVLMSEKFKRTDMDLPIALGKTISNEVFVADLAKMPHLLIAGATGQGKSVGINAILMSLLYKKHPSQVKLILVDPKKVELFPYSDLENHFLGFLPNQMEPITTDTTKVIHTLNSLCIEMDERYNLLKKASARNIKEYNEKFVGRHLNPEKGHRFMPFIVLIIDEFADLIMTAGKEVELPIGRLAQLSRAVGIHLIIATQRPSVNIITGVIKANFPARLAFKVSSKVDSRTILDSGGAEQLIGRGDMLLSIGGDMIRLQCAFVDTPEVERVIKFIGEQQGYPEPFLLPEFKGAGDDADFNEKDKFSLSDLDEMFDDAARLVVQNQHGSTSMIQRRMKLGYNRAGRIMDQLESFGIVGPSEGSKPREVLFFEESELERFLGNLKSKR